MRELSVVELDLIVGGYDQGGGSFDEYSYEPIATAEADGSYTLEVSEAEYQMQQQAASDDGWKIEITGTVNTNGSGSVSVKASKSC